MVFKKLLGSLGIGAPTVDTVLDGGPVTPGGTLTGQVHMRGGQADFDIQHITLELVAQVEAEHSEGEAHGVIAFHRAAVGGGFRLHQNEQRALPFSLPLPWETPVTELHGQPLGVVLGVRTELVVASARDAGDMDPVTVSPLPVQEAVLDAFGRLGFGFKSADLELGHLHGTGQQLPFYQEIELHPAPQYAHAVQEIEVTFLAGPGGMEVVLEADKRGGFFTGGHDAVSRFTVGHHEQHDWTALVDSWVRRMVENHAAHPHHAAPHDPPMHQGHHGGHPLPYPQQGYVDKDGHGGHHGPRHGHGGPGMGTAVAAGAAGLAAGVAGGMVLDEVFDDDGGDEGGDEE
ncbi:sporulation protein [Streptomyces sp. YIM 98790]|uniref:sporulation protein n=1 Tax=Streptomyces sp. YIM 98790 TaxID=2689077 RepID=UPI0014082956|nr:sporulation protein [Streptomyces sp. YIM 98790]